MPELETEKVTQNYEPRPGEMKARTFWIAYPGHVSAYAAMGDRITRAWGRGATRAGALEAAARRGGA